MVAGREPSPVASLPLTPLERVHVLDAAADWIDFKYFRAIVDEEPKALALKTGILRARSQIPIQSEKLDGGMPVQKAPHTGHDSMRVGVSQGSGKNTATGLSFRFALHEALDPKAGHSDEAQIQFFHFGIEKPWAGAGEGSPGVRITRADLVEILSTSPWSIYSRSLSWHLRIGTETLSRAWCENCYGPRFTLGGGFTSLAGDASGASHFWLATFVEAETVASSGLRDAHFAAGLGPTLIGLARFSDKTALELRGHYSAWLGLHPHGLLETKTELRSGLGQNFAGSLGVRYQEAQNYRDLAPFMSAYLYF